MKYAKHLKCLYYIGKCSKYLYYMKKILCICGIAITALIGISLVSKGSYGIKALKGLM